MASGGDILVIQKQSERPFAVDVFLDGATTSFTAVTSRGVNHTIYVQKIVLGITTHANTKVVQVTDSAGTPVVFASHTDLTAAAGVPSMVEWNFAPHGIALTAGKNLLVTSSASGPVGVVHFEGYEKLSATISTATANTAN